MANDEWAICFFNRSQQPSDFTFNWERETFKDNVFDKEITFNRDNVYKIRDLYQHKMIGDTKKALKQKLESNQSLVVKIFK